MTATVLECGWWSSKLHVLLSLGQRFGAKIFHKNTGRIRQGVGVGNPAEEIVCGPSKSYAVSITDKMDTETDLGRIGENLGSTRWFGLPNVINRA
jgi:hypothetical protein